MLVKIALVKLEIMSSMNAQLIALSAMLNSKASNGNASRTETRVKPTSKRNLAPVEPIPLHGFDIIMPLVNVRIPFMFKMSEDAIPREGSASGGSGCSSKGSLSSGLRERFESIVAKLKESLAEALELYPPVAGTICISPDDDSAVTIVCNAKGATFITEIEERKYEESEHLLDGLSGTTVIPVDTSNTLFAAKLTLVGDRIRRLWISRLNSFWSSSPVARWLWSPLSIIIWQISHHTWILSTLGTKSPEDHILTI